MRVSVSLLCDSRLASIMPANPPTMPPAMNSPAIRHLRHVRYPDIFALGDAASTATAKTAAAVRKQAPIVVANLLAAMKAEPLPKAHDGYGSCPLTVVYGKIVLAEFAYGGKVTPSLPFDPRIPRRSMWLLKTKLLPWLYWSHMFKGGEFDIPHRARGW
jgi:sulfide:quinone oxidoreductase